jgi:hypothetical protein
METHSFMLIHSENEREGLADNFTIWWDLMLGMLERKMVGWYGIEITGVILKNKCDMLLD